MKQNKEAWWFFLGLVILGGIWYFTAGRPAAGRLAAIGGTVALYGVLLLARPVLRYGTFRFILVTTFGAQEGFSKVDFYDRVPQAKRAELEASDIIYQQVFGPGLVGIGTAISAFSGLF